MNILMIDVYPPKTRKNRKRKLVPVAFRQATPEEMQTRFAKECGRQVRRDWLAQAAPEECGA